MFNITPGNIQLGRIERYIYLLRLQEIKIGVASTNFDGFSKTDANFAIPRRNTPVGERDPNLTFRNVITTTLYHEATTTYMFSDTADNFKYFQDLKSA